MSWFYALLKCIFCYQDDDYNEREEGNRYCESGRGTAVGRSSFHPRSSGKVQQFDSKTRALLGDVKLAHSSVADVSTRKGSLPQSSKGPSITYERYVHPRIPITSHVPPIVPIAPPQQACPFFVPQTVVVKDWLSAYEDPLSSSSYASYAPPRSLSSNSSTKTKPPLSSSSKPSTYSPTKTPSISKPLSSSTSRSSAEHSFKSSSSSGKPSLYSMSKPSTSPPEKAPPLYKSWQPPPPPSPSSSSSSSSQKSALPTFKPTLAPSSPSISRDPSRKTNYTCIEKGTTPFFVIPKDIAELIKKDVVPKVLHSPLSPSTYTDYFAALLYAEDFYCEKWSKYLLKNVTLELHDASIYTKGKKICEKDCDDKTFVAFGVDSVQERRPFLLSRDFVRLQPSDRDYSFQGVIYRVVKSKTVLAEFNEDFYAEHYSSRTYNVSFSFNRFCLKRAHQAIKAASNPLFQSFLFPADSLYRSSSSPTSNFFASKLDFEQKYAVSRILGLKGSPPFLVEGEPSQTGLVVREAIVHIVRIFPNSRILVCAPTNRTCDVLMANLKKEISESDMFRANAAFRELDEVPVELLPSCRYNDECFTCPSLMKLKKFRVVSSTFVSSFRLNGEGITAGHFTHIFLVDGSSVTEPQLMIALATFANVNTTVVVTGASNNRSRWVRSTIARENGLMISYFERLCKRPPYKDLEPWFLARLGK